MNAKFSLFVKKAVVAVVVFIVLNLLVGLVVTLSAPGVVILGLIAYAANELV